MIILPSSSSLKAVKLNLSEYRETNLISLALLFHYLMLNIFRILIHPSSGACDLFLSYFMDCIALVRCLLVLRCGLAVVVWYPYAG